MSADTSPAHQSPRPSGAEALARAERDERLADWLGGAALGRSADFEHFYDATVGYARALARRIVAAADIDDALADAYLEAWRRVARFDRQRGSAVTWLLTIVHSRAIDLRRRQHASNPLDESRAEQEGGGTDPGEHLWQTESGQQLHRALAALSGQERWVLGLAYFRDLSHAAIADATGLPLGTVKSLITRAHGKLRARLGELT